MSNEEKTVVKKVEVKKQLKSGSIKTKAFDVSTLNGKMLLVRVGDDERPAIQEDIDDVENKLSSLIKKNRINCVVFVTHHRVRVDIIA